MLMTFESGLALFLGHGSACLLGVRRRGGKWDGGLIDDGGCVAVGSVR